MNVPTRGLIPGSNRDVFTSVLLLTALVTVGLAGAAVCVASPPDGFAQAETPAGADLWILSVGPQFQPSEVEAIGGTCHWHWTEAGIALASSSSDTFEQDAEGGDNIDWAVADLAFPLGVPDGGYSLTDKELKEAEDEVASMMPPDDSLAKDQSIGIGTEYFQIVGGPDVYAINGQWPLYAIGAARPVEIPPVYSTPVNAGPGPKRPLYKTHYTPQWQLDQIDGHDYTGSGVTVGFVDTGMPAVWVDGPVPTVPLLDETGKQIVDRWGDPVYIHQSELHPEFDWFDPAFPEDGGIVPPGYDAEIPDWLRLDRFDDKDGHGTATMGLLAAQYSKQVYGAMRGIAPKATIISYNITYYQGDYGKIQGSKIFRAWKRAASDGVQILNNSWGGNRYPESSFGKWVERYERLARNAANELSRQGVFVVAAAGNEGMLLESQHGNPFWVHKFPQDAPNVFVVSGTGPRDYEPIQSAGDAKFDLSCYMPEAPGRPYDLLNRALNLDRPMLDYIWPPFVTEPTLIGATNFGGGIDVAAPAGAKDIRDLVDLNNPVPPPLAEVVRRDNNLVYTTFPAPNAIFGTPYRPDRDYGLHTLSSGTSFAAPYACGTAALAMEAYRRQWGQWPTVATLRHIVLTSADDLVGPITEDQAFYDPYYHEDPDYPFEKIGQDKFYGAGRINAFNAIVHARAFK